MFNWEVGKCTICGEEGRLRTRCSRCGKYACDRTRCIQLILDTARCRGESKRDDTGDKFAAGERLD